MAKTFGLGKNEKLKSRKAVEELFARGKGQNIFPVRISYKFLPIEEGEKAGLQIGVSVSKKHFKKAVDRNRIKRLLREAYRLQKNDLLDLVKAKQLKGFVFFIYTDKTLPEYKIVFDAMTKCLETLKRKINSEKPS